MKKYIISRLVQQIYDKYVTEKEKKSLLSDKVAMFGKDNNIVRIQCYMPKEIYIILASFGAFISSESDFFSTLAISYIEDSAVKLGIVQDMLKSAAGEK